MYLRVAQRSLHLQFASRSSAASLHRLQTAEQTRRIHHSKLLSMPASKTSKSSAKRSAPDSASLPSNKRQYKATNGDEPGEEYEAFHVVDRRFYPPEMTNARCLEYNNNQHKRPIERLEGALSTTRNQRSKLGIGKAVVHWFKCDLRTHDNKALHLASEKARIDGVPLICIYIVSPQDFEAHVTSPPRVDFILRSLEVVQKDLAAVDIPLYVETVTRRKNVPGRILELCEEWGAKHLFANVEYEVDELRREADMVTTGLDRGIAVDIVPDTCVVAPGELASGSGSQYAVYSPWFRAWVAYLHKHPDHLKLYDMPSKNPGNARKDYKKLFDCTIPDAPPSKKLSNVESKRFRSMWPAGEHEAKQRLHKFLNEKAGSYKDQRNFPAANATAVISVHLASGTLAARSAIVAAQEMNSTKKLDGGNAGIAGWISEVAWRDFYKHVLAHWPFVW